MRHIVSILFVIILSFLFVACGGRTIGAGNDNDNENVNTNNPADGYVTRRLAVQGTVNSIMGYYVDWGPCEEDWNDIDGQSGRDTPDQFLCWSLDYLERRGVNFGYQDGNFRPDEPMNKAEIWKIVVLGMGLAPFINDCNGDVPADAWYADYSGALCEHVLLHSGPSDPGGTMTLPEWYSMLARIDNFLDQPASRHTTMEALLTILVQRPFSESCPEPPYDDVEPESLECYVTQVLTEESYLDPNQQSFRPFDTVNWSELAKVAAKAAGLTETQCNGCSGLTTDSWACGWADALCQEGFLPDAFSANEVPTQREVYRLFWDLQMHYFPEN